MGRPTIGMLMNNRIYPNSNDDVGAYGITPGSIPGCIHWWRADKGVTLAPTNKVTQWVDSIGGMVLTLSVVGINEPVLLPTGSNGFPAIQFASGDKFLVDPIGQNLSNALGALDYSMLIVTRHGVPTGQSPSFTFQGLSAKIMFMGQAVIANATAFEHPGIVGTRLLSENGSDVKLNRRIFIRTTVASTTLIVASGTPVIDTTALTTGAFPPTIVFGMGASGGFSGESIITDFAIYKRSITDAELVRFDNEYYGPRYGL